MARYSSTSSGDLTTTILGHLIDAASMGKVEKARAVRGAEISKMKPEDMMLRPGEFTAQALKYKMTPRWARGRSFGNKYPDYFAKNLKGQSTPFASPINPEPTFASIKEKMVGNPFPYIAAPYREHQVQPQTPLLSSGTKRYESTVSEKKKPVQVKDEKLGIFFAAIAESLNQTVSSINQKQSTIESDIVAAKESNLALAEGLKYSNDTIGDKLDAIAELLNQQMKLAKNQIDQAETDEAIKEFKKEDDLSGGERYVDVGEKTEPVRRENELENMLDVDNDEKIQDFESGGIASGPDSGYLARLHGNELIVPLDNNYTQGQPSAVDGVTRRPQYEAGTGGLTAKSTPIPQQPPTSTAFNFFNNRPSEHAGTPTVLDLPEPNMKVSGESLMKAMKLPFEVASLGIMQATGNAVRAIPGFDAMKQTVSAVVNPVAQAFSIKDTISGKVNNLLETKSLQTERRNQEVYKREQSENRRAWWDIFGLFRSDSGGEGGDPYGVGGPGLSSGGLQNLYHGTSNARAGKIFSGGFKPSNAMSWAGRGKSFLTPDFFDAAKYARPGATGLNPFSVKGLPGTGLNNLNNARGQVLNILQPRGAGLRLPGWLRNLGLAPEVAVNPKQATKGLNLSQKLLGGAYPNSSTANAARRLMTSPASGRGLGLMSKLSPMLRAGGGLLGKLSRVPMLSDMLFPDPTAQYDQMHGPNAYFNDPRFTGPRPEWAPPLNSGSKSAIVDMGSKEHVMNRLSKKEVDPSTFTVNNLDSANLQQPNEATSHIDNMGDSQVEQYQFVYSAFK